MEFESHDNSLIICAEPSSHKVTNNFTMPMTNIKNANPWWFVNEKTMGGFGFITNHKGSHNNYEIRFLLLERLKLYLNNNEKLNCFWFLALRPSFNQYKILIRMRFFFFILNFITLLEEILFCGRIDFFYSVLISKPNLNFILNSESQINFHFLGIRMKKLRWQLSHIIHIHKIQ